MQVKKSLTDAFFCKTGKSIDKWEQYLGIYDREVDRFLHDGKPVHLLEVGVQNGGSLELWADLLPGGSTVTGFDVDPRVGDLVFDATNIRAHVVDGTDLAAVQRAVGDWSFYIIIDDGSHVVTDVVSSFEILWDRVRPGGVYIIEDLHCSYYGSHGGGFRRPGSSIEWLKSVVDALNLDYAGEAIDGQSDAGMLRRLGATVASVTFYDSVAVIERFTADKLRPFRRVFSGDVSEVSSNVTWMAAQKRTGFASMIFGAAAARSLSFSLIEGVERAAATGEERDRLSAERVEILKDRDEARLSLAALSAKAVRLQAELADRSLGLEAAEGEVVAAQDRLSERTDEVAGLKCDIVRLEELNSDLAQRLEKAEAALAGAGASLRQSREQLDASLAQRVDERRAAKANHDHDLGEIARVFDRAGFAPGMPLPVRVGALLSQRASAAAALSSIFEFASLQELRAGALRLRFDLEANRTARLGAAVDELRGLVVTGFHSRSRRLGRLLRRMSGRRVVDDLDAVRRTDRAVATDRSDHAILSTGVFDAAFYLAENPDVAEAGEDPVEHYLTAGNLEQRSIHPVFNDTGYRRANPDVAAVAPLAHYLRYGVTEDRAVTPGGTLRERAEVLVIRLSGLFDDRFYQDNNPDLGPEDDPLLHFVRFGAVEGRDPSPWFGLVGYRESHADVAGSGMNPLVHYILHGLGEGRIVEPSSAVGGDSPLTDAEFAEIRESGLVDLDWYASFYEDVPAGQAWDHYVRVGCFEGRWPNALFDPRWYVSHYDDVGRVSSALLHYIRHGDAQGRHPSAEFDPSFFDAAPLAGGTRLRRYIDAGQAWGNGFAMPAVAVAAERAAPAPVASATPATTARDALRAFGAQWTPMRVFHDPRAQRTVTLVTDSVASHSLFGGVGTAIVFAALLAKRVDARLRIVTRTTEPDPQAVGDVLSAHGIEWSGSTDFRFIPWEGENAIAVGPDDLLVTTSWWTTRATRAVVPASMVVYLLQEDERMFYPFGDIRLRCAETLAGPGIKVVINSARLREHLCSGPDAVPGLAARSRSFEPAFPAVRNGPDPVRPDGKRNLFFYARPRHDRNLYWRGLEALDQAVVEGVIDGDRWTIHFVGSDVGDVRIGGVKPMVIAKMPWLDYAKFVTRMDVGLSLMDTPHSSYPPIDLAAGGAVVVTNAHGLKRSFDDLSANILAVEPSVDGIVEGLRRAVAVVDDDALRRSRFDDQSIPYEWPVQLEGALAFCVGES